MTAAMPMLTRRRFVAAGLCGCMLCGSGTVAGRVPPASMQPLVGPGYRPVDPDEKGLWQSCERLEDDLRSSNLLLHSPGMQAYTEGVMQRLLGDRAKDTRVYLVHDPDFNASMAPNGMMIVQTGLLARVRNEAQLATVLGHESGHYLRRHSVAQWRDRKRKTGIVAFVGAGSGVLAGVTAMAGGDGRSWIDLGNSVNTGLIHSIFAFSREQESEADAYGIKLMEEAGYAPEAAQAMWTQYTEERRASAANRGKRYRDGSASLLSTHPPTETRMLDLATSAREIETVTVTGRHYDEGREAWRQAVAPLRAALLDEQVKLNDSGASLYLINALAQDGWDGTLRFYEGEAYRLRDRPGDGEKAAAAYSSAVALADAPAEAWRAQGYALLKTGKNEDGRRCLTRYLELKPQASDAAMVRFSLNQ